MRIFIESFHSLSPRNVQALPFQINAREEFGEIFDEYMVNVTVPTLLTKAIRQAVTSVGVGSESVTLAVV